MRHRDYICLKKIVDEINVALNMMSDMEFSEFDADEVIKRAVCMTAINIGELVKGLSADFRVEHANIPWKDVAGFRDIAAHKYATLRMKDVYNTVTRDFPELAENIKAILADEQEGK